MAKLTWLAGLAFGAVMLGLNACDAPESELQDFNDDSGDNLNKNSGAHLMEDKNSEFKNEMPDSFSEDDREKIFLYGTCSSILKTIVFTINNQNLYFDPSVELMRSTAAHQATIYSILTYDRIAQYPENLHEAGMEIGNNFMNENILNKTLSIPQLYEMNQSKCNFEDVSDLAGSIMRDNNFNYEEQFEINKSLGL